MSDALFLSQRTLEAWLDQEKVELDGQTLRLLEDSSHYQLEPALHINVVLDGEDSQKLSGKTCTLAEFEAAKADCFRNSVVLGETAYEGEEGFVVTWMPQKDSGGVNSHWREVFPSALAIRIPKPVLEGGTTRRLSGSVSGNRTI